MSAWVWLPKPLILAVHERQLAEHGGSVGIRDEGLLESALARPENQAAYGNPDASALAAAYAFGIAKNHPFVDGNKRTAHVAARLFLALHGGELSAPLTERYTSMIRLAEGSWGEAEYADWLRRNLRKG